MNYKKLVENFKEAINDSDPVNKTGFKVHDIMHQKFWMVENILNPKIRDQLIDIVKEFWKNLEVDAEIKDITMTGSLANFNWSIHSDIDIHIITDYGEVDADLDLVRDYYNARKSLWNQKHNIDIFGFEVEIYVQDDNEEHVSTGVYSLTQNKWLIKPVKEDFKIDWQNVQDKALSLMDQIDRLDKFFDEDRYREAYEYGQKLKDKIKKFRRTGLETVGQYSPENIAFKVLRRNGYLEKLIGLRILAYDKMNSIKDETLNITINESVKKWKQYLKK